MNDCALVRVDPRLNPWVDLQIEGHDITFLLDTGFRGVAHLAMRPHDLNKVSAVAEGQVDVKFADERVQTLELYSLDLTFAGKSHEVKIVRFEIDDGQAIERQPVNLIGMSLLSGHYLAVSVKPNGEGSITPLP